MDKMENKIEAEVIDKIHNEINPLRERISSVETSLKHHDKRLTDTNVAIFNLDAKMDRRFDTIDNTIEEKFGKIMDNQVENTKMIYKMVGVGTGILATITIAAALVNYLI